MLCLCMILVYILRDFIFKIHAFLSPSFQMACNMYVPRTYFYNFPEVNFLRTIMRSPLILKKPTPPWQKDHPSNQIILDFPYIFCNASRLHEKHKLLSEKFTWLDKQISRQIDSRNQLQNCTQFIGILLMNSNSFAIFFSSIIVVSVQMSLLILSLRTPNKGLKGLLV